MPKRPDHLRLVDLVEAAEGISQELRARFPKIEWRHAVALRNRLAHGYFDVDIEIVYITAIERLPKLASDVRAVLATEFPEYTTE